VTTTLAIYAHLFDDDHAETMAALDALVAPMPSCTGNAVPLHVYPSGLRPHTATLNSSVSFNRASSSPASWWLHIRQNQHTPPSRTCPTTARRKPVTIRCTPERAGLLTNPQCDCSRPTHAEHHRHIRNILDAYPPSGCTLEESQAVPEAISTIVRETPTVGLEFGALSSPEGHQRHSSRPTT